VPLHVQPNQQLDGAIICEATGVSSSIQQQDSNLHRVLVLPEDLPQHVELSSPQHVQHSQADLLHLQTVHQMYQTHVSNDQTQTVYSDLAICGETQQSSLAHEAIDGQYHAQHKIPQKNESSNSTISHHSENNLETSLTDKSDFQNDKDISNAPQCFNEDTTTSDECHHSDQLQYKHVELNSKLKIFRRPLEGVAFGPSSNGEVCSDLPGGSGDEQKGVGFSYSLETSGSIKLNLFLTTFNHLESHLLSKVSSLKSQIHRVESLTLCQGIDEQMILPFFNAPQHLSVFTIEKWRESFRYRTRQCDLVTTDSSHCWCEPCRIVFADLFSVPKMASDAVGESEDVETSCSVRPASIECYHCTKVFSSQRLLTKHLKASQSSSNSTESKKCLYCDKYFQVKVATGLSQRYVHHLRSVHAKHKHRPDFVEAVARHASLQVKCSYCENTFATKKARDAHQRLEHHTSSAESDANHNCHVCGKMFKTYSTLYGHMKTHEDGKFICTVCGSTFKVRSYLQRHLASHDQSNKRFECDLCDKKFSQPYLMRQHKEFSHMKNLPFKCELCGKPARTMTRLKIHIRAVHSKEKPFPCEVCGFKSARMDNLNIHRRKMHTIPSKLTRLALVQLVDSGRHPFCKDSKLIPQF